MAQEASHPPPATRRPSASSTEATPAQATGLRVLLVEDNALIEQHITHILQAIGGTQVVEVARTGADACEWLQAHPDGWDLALIDLFLRQGHGFDVLKACRKVRPHQRAVVLSNYTRQPVPESARQAGADAVFDKSFDMDALVDYCVELSRRLPA